MSLSANQKVVSVTGANLESAAAELVNALGSLPNARILTFVSEVDRWSTFRPRTTILAVVQHD